MKIQGKLLLSYFVIVLLFFASGFFSTTSSMKMSELQRNVAQQIDIAHAAAGYQQGIYEKQFGAFVYGLGNSEQGNQMITSAEENHIEPSESFLFANLTNNQELYGKFNAAYEVEENQIGNVTDQIKAISNGNSATKFEDLSAALAQMNSGVDAVNKKLTEFNIAADAQAKNAVTESQNYANFSNIMSLVFVIGIGAGSAALAVFMGKRITNPLRKLTDVAGKVSMGELNHEINITTKDEIADLGEAFQRMINAFKMTVALSQENEETEKQ
jgi:methyl-accepting chemotaxis protein